MLYYLIIFVALLPSNFIKQNIKFNSEAMKAQALKTAQEAYSTQQARLSMFSSMEGESLPNVGGSKEAKEHPQPIIFKGILKSYQMKGMNWLANLYYFVSSHSFSLCLFLPFSIFPSPLPTPIPYSIHFPFCFLCHSFSVSKTKLAVYYHCKLIWRWKYVLES